MASATTSFAYQRLEAEDTNSIRLLSLLPGDGDAPIECTLMHTRRDSQCQPYEALSYAWGNPTLNSDIIVNGSQLPVTRNLEQALRSLKNREGGLPRTLWVDAICIDQSHISERNHQVAQMGGIYAGAERVVIWLGEASKDSDMALAFMLKLHEVLAAKGEISKSAVLSGQYPLTDFTSTLKEIFLDQKSSDALKAGAQILARPWWQRAWIVQEVVIAKDAICYCGTMSISWIVMETFIIAASYGNNIMPRESAVLFNGNGNAGIARDICHLRSKFRSGPIHLWKLLQRLYRQHCTDPRDKIYSVLGMTHPSVRESLKPDYAKPVSQVFTMAIAADIAHGGDLFALLLVDHSDRPTIEDLPSWVADLRNTFTRVNMLPPQPLKPSTFSFSQDLTILCADGFAVDSIVENKIQDTDATFHSLMRAFRHDKWTWNIDNIVARLLDEGGVYVSKELDNPYNNHRNVERIVYEVMSTGMINSSLTFMKHNITYPDEGGNGSEAPAKKDALGTRKFQHHSLQRAFSLWWNIVNHRPWKSSLKPRRWRDILITAVELTQGRTLILSSKRHLGLAPIATQPGDCIFVLSGLHELAILRPQKDGTYKFIGVSYVHGFMNNEWEEDLKRGVFRKERVSIS